MNKDDKKTLESKSISISKMTFDSTNQINRYFVNMPEDIKIYLHEFKKQNSLKEIEKTIKAMRNLKVLVLGDTIIDDYQYCTTIGKSSKDPALALKYESHDLFAGGVVAVANHVAGFSDKVDLITILGESDSHEAFIRSSLKKNVQPKFFFKPKSPTLIKRRFLDGYSMNKLLEIYIMNDSALDQELDEAFSDCIKSMLPDYDLVIVADYGHGTINMKLKEILSSNAPYLAINAQSNAGNRGFNNISKYPDADYVSMAEHEIRLEKRDLTSEIPPMMRTVVKSMNCSNMVVTRGRKGCLVMDNQGVLIRVPSFAQKVVDRVGAGDAFFAVTALAAFQNASCERIGFLGNVAGALAVETMGNKKALDAQAVTRYLQSNFFTEIT